MSPRHAAPGAAEYRTPARYLTGDTMGRPLILLVSPLHIADEWPDDGLPVGVGLTPRPDQVDLAPCEDCGATAWVWQEDPSDDGPGDTECLLCLTMQAGVSYGVVPAMSVQWVPTL